MEESQTWRELLAKIISDPHERQRLAGELSVSLVTLNRWIKGDSAPRPQNMRHLLNVVPQYRDEFLELLRSEEDAENLISANNDDSEQEIPTSFYIRVFNARASTVESLHFWSISTLILQQAISQLDPERLGMSIYVVRCMPPQPQRGSRKVRSLRESVGAGTPPWPGDLEQQALFLGAESLAGYAVSLCRPSGNQNIGEGNNLVPTHPGEYEKSAVAYPILYTGRIAGCLLVSSTQINYFHSSARLALVQSYTDLIALAFEAEDFYDPQDIELQVMPHHSIQRHYFANFRQRVANTMIQAAQKQRPVNNLQAEQAVWQELEEELLQRSTDT
jgi:transcriptional regulator with XRE-family HTH domain